jgi:hypothetical protein
LRQTPSVVEVMQWKVRPDAWWVGAAGGVPRRASGHFGRQLLATADRALLDPERTALDCTRRPELRDAAEALGPSGGPIVPPDVLAALLTMSRVT